MGDNEIEKKVIQHDEHLKSIDRRLDKVENISENLNKVSISLEKLNLSVESIVNSQKKQAEDIEMLKLQPGNTAKNLWLKVAEIAIAVTVTAIVTALIMLIIKQ